MDNKNTRVHNLYWRKVRLFTILLVALWFVSTFGIIFFARELAAVTVLGWPVSFYMAAQGLTVLYLGIVAAYAIYMRRLDRLLRSETSNAK